MLSYLLFQKIAQLFIILFMGFLLVRCGKLKSGDSRYISMITLYLINPCVMITAYQIDWTPEILKSLAFSLGAAVLCHIILIGMTLLLRRPLKLSTVEQASLVYSNCVNLLIPLVASILGKEWVIYTSMYMIVHVFLLWSHCRMLLSGEKTISFKNIFGNLNMISMLVGLVLMLFRIPIPALLLGAMESVSSTLGPVSMIIIGMLIAGVDLKELFRTQGVWKAVFLRLIGLPLLILVFLKYSGIAALVPGGADILLITLLAAAAPSGTMVSQLAQVYGGDARYAGAINVITTLLCIITMPLMVWLYQL